MNDPESMAKTMPGVQSFDVHDDRHWTANVKIPLGLGGLKMKVDMEKVEEREPEFAKIGDQGQRRRRDDEHGDVVHALATRPRAAPRWRGAPR